MRIFVQVHPVQGNLWLTTRSTLLPTYFSKCLPVDLFLASLSISPQTHILQIMFKNNNSKNTTIIAHLKRWPFNATVTLFLFLSELFLYFFFMWLAIVHVYINIMTQLHILFKKNHKVFLCNSLRKIKTSQDQRLCFHKPGHKHIFPGFLMTIHQTSTLLDLTWSNWGISKNPTKISPWPQTNTSKWHYKWKCMQQQPKYTALKHLSAIDFLLNQLLLLTISPS